MPPPPSSRAPSLATSPSPLEARSFERAGASERSPFPNSAAAPRLDGADLAEPLQRLLFEQALARGVDLT
jgi:hypothetical protein